MTLAAGLAAPLGHARAQRVRLDIGLQAQNLIDPNLLIGEWLTIIRHDGGPQPVRLTIHTVEPGKTAGKLIYSSPRRCVVDLEYGGPDEDRHVFYMVPFTNCFDYQKTDHVAIWMAEPAPRSEQSRPDPTGGYRSLPTHQKARGDEGASEAGPAGTSVIPPGRRIEQVRYAVTLGDHETESALLTRQ